MNIGILTAMSKEHDRIAALLDERRTTEGRFRVTTGRIGGTHTRVALMQCGIGKVNAAVGTAELIRTYAPDCVVSTGCAGGTADRLHVMDVVVADRTVQHDFNIGMGCEKGQVQGMPTYFPSDAALVETARSLGRDDLHVGLVATGDQFVTDPKALGAIMTDFPQTLAVDMESAAIAQTCYVLGVKFVSFRIVSDTPGSDGHIQQYEHFWTDMAERSFGVTRDYLLALSEREDEICGAAGRAPRCGAATERCGGVAERCAGISDAQGGAAGAVRLEKIASFTVNHRRLLRGVYVSRRDEVGGDCVTTFDVRMKEPNREPALSPAASHTIEHLAATFLRNHPVWRDRVVYWGPMGCLTGHYLLLRGRLEAEDVLELLRETFRFIVRFRGRVPGASPRDCGNYLLMNLGEAQWEAAKYLSEVLDVATAAHLHYPES